MAVALPFHLDYYILQKSERTFEKQLKDLEHANRKDIEALVSARMDRLLMSQELEKHHPALALHYQTLCLKINEIEDVLIDRIKQYTKAVQNLFSVKKHLSNIRRLLEIRTNSLGEEKRHHYMMQLEYRKLHHMITDYVTFFKNQIEAYEEADKNFPDELIKEFGSNLSRFKQMREELQTKSTNMRNYFEEE